MIVKPRKIYKVSYNAVYCPWIKQAITVERRCKKCKHHKGIKGQYVLCNWEKEKK